MRRSVCPCRDRIHNLTEESVSHKRNPHTTTILARTRIRQSLCGHDSTDSTPSARCTDDADRFTCACGAVGCALYSSTAGRGRVGTRIFSNTEHNTTSI